MNELFNYINSNAFLATIIGVFFGWVLSFATTIYISNKEKRERREEIRIRDRKKQFEMKPELELVNDENNKEPQLEIYLGIFDIKYTDDKKYQIVHDKNLSNKSEHEYEDYVFENVGKGDILSFSIATTNKRNIILGDYRFLSFFDENYVNYSSICDRKIKVGEKIKVRIYFLKNARPQNALSATLVTLVEDKYHTYWEQAFFYNQRNLYSPEMKSYKEYRQTINADDAYKCFENPWLW